MSDILFSVAWECGDRDCRVQWHKANYWTTEEGGYSVDNYSDGDHDDIDETDLPSMLVVDRSWREYAEYVARSGEDPLGEYMVKRSVKIRERWQFRFVNSIVGPKLLDARHAGQSYVPNNLLPEHVRSYLALDKNRRIADFADWKAFEEAVPGVQPMRWTTIQIEHDRPRNPEAMSRELKRLARRQLKQKQAA